MTLRRSLPFLLPALLFLGYLGFVAQKSSYVASGSDQSGYVNFARQILQGSLDARVPQIEGLHPPEWTYELQQPLGYRVDPQTGTRVPTYPIGMALHLVAAAPFVGLDYAGTSVNVLLAGAAGLLMALLGRRLGLPWSWAWAGTVLFWLCPLTIFMSLQVMSDVAAAVWSMAAIYLALRGREHWGWALGAGVALALAVLVRPTNVLLTVPILIALGGRFRLWVCLGLGGLPGAVFQLWLNHRLYGAYLTTGYPNVDVLFAWRFVPHNAVHFVQWIGLLLTPLVALPGVIALATRTLPPRVRWLLGSWIAALLGFYVFYFHSGETWWYLRFILPAFPAFIIAALLWIRPRLERIPSAGSRRRIAVGALLACVLFQFILGQRLGAWYVKHGEYHYTRSAAWARDHLPANALVVCMQTSGAFTYYTDFTLVRWDMLHPKTWAALQQAARAAGRPLYAVLFSFELQPALQERVPGNWERLTEEGQVTAWRLKD